MVVGFVVGGAAVLGRFAVVLGSLAASLQRGGGGGGGGSEGKVEEERKEGREIEKVLKSE